MKKTFSISDKCCGRVDCVVWTNCVDTKLECYTTVYYQKIKFKKSKKKVSPSKCRVRQKMVAAT